MARADLVGQRFGHYVVVAKLAPTANRNGRWLCRCDCGNERPVRVDILTSGQARSCGCGLVPKVRPKHGGRKTPEYTAWQNMLARCSNPSHPNFPNYGGRGIRVCEEWRSFSQFIADMGPQPPSPARMTLDRVDNDKGYEPGNCRWTTYAVQNLNRRVTRRLTHEGLTLTVPEWAQRIGVDATLLHGRLGRGWDEERTLTEPVHTNLSRRRTGPSPVSSFSSVGGGD